MKGIRGDRELVSALSLVCALVLGGVWVARTTGVHLDENNYLKLAQTSPLGDAATTGKPVLFYVLNYLVQFAGHAAGRLAPLSLHVFYLTFFSMALAWSVVTTSRGEPLWTVMMKMLVLVAAPIALVNATTVMMESAALPLLSVVVGLVLSGRGTRASRILLTLTAMATAATKSTTVPALLLVAWSFRGRLAGRSVCIPLGVVLGLAINYTALLLLHAVPVAYGGPAELLSLTRVTDRLSSRTLSYFYVWAFFAGAATTMATVASRSWTNREVVRLLAGSLVGVALVALMSNFPFARYCYPLLWVALLGTVLAVRFSNRAIVLALVVMELVQARPLVSHGQGRFWIWPSAVTGELIESGATVFVGFPIYGLTLGQLIRDPEPCVWVNSDGGEKNEVIEQFATIMFPHATRMVTPVFPTAGVGSCSPSNTIRFRREHVDGVSVGCPQGGRCELQRVDFFSNVQGWVRNQVAFPRVR